MKNDYLSNKKFFELNKEKSFRQTTHLNKNLIKPINVNINTLLNRVKINEKNKNKENLILLGMAIFVLSIIGFITIL
tara:strand:- start:70 stop:300 length:231 start_codon:yes stop_codon:yes gene_type:complete